MKSEGDTKLDSSIGLEMVPPEIVGNESSLGPLEMATEAKEKRKSTSWMKNIGSGMRTLRLRKHGDKDKKAETVLENLANDIAVDSFDSTGQTVTALDVTKSPPPPRIPLPPLPSPPESIASSTTTSVTLPSPSTPSKGKKVKKKKSNESNTSSVRSMTARLSLTKSKSGKKDVTVTGTNGSAVVVLPEKFSSSGGGISIPETASSALDKADPARFIGEGLSFKAKLIGILEVSGPRGDRICQEALSELKMAVKAAGEHKQKVTIHVALDGLRVRDEKTGDCLYHHQVHKISFIAQDLTDARAFGYIFGSPDTGHRFFGIKTEKSASQVVMSMRDLFQVVFDLKKKEIERAKQQLEIQQKFLATRASETSAATRTCHKSGIAETYIDGASAILQSSANQNSASGPAEADLLNLEVELTSLQEGLENIHSTIIDTATAHLAFNRGSTASISSDPMNPGSATFPKYNSHNLTNSFATNQSGVVVVPNQTIPSLSQHCPAVPSNPADPFGDSFDPFDSSIGGGKGVTSPSFPVDPFVGVDPFTGSKFPTESLESSDLIISANDPFETPIGGCTFNFPEMVGTSGRGSINRQISITSNSSDISSGKVSLGPESSISKHALSSVPSPNLNKSEVSIPTSVIVNWTASFDDNFGSNNGTGGKDSGFDDLFTELDPLGTGRVRPFINRKDFFQDLKNPSKKVLNELSGGGIVSSKDVIIKTTFPPTTESVAVTSSSPLPNSFSTNFNPPVAMEFIETTLVKVPPPLKSEGHLRTSSIRAPPAYDSPPSYSPPLPPAYPQPSSFYSSTQSKLQSHYTSIHSTPPTAKKSPQLLRNMTIATAGHVLSSGAQGGSPKTLPRTTVGTTKQQSTDMLSNPKKDEIPNLTPPPRPPHSTISSGISTLTRGSILTSAVPRPHSGEGKRTIEVPISSPLSTSAPLSKTNMTIPPEPPPRPISTTTAEPILLPPPLPPKKQTIGGPVVPNLSFTKLNYNAASKWKVSDESWTNDLPLPLPSRKGNTEHSNAMSQQLPRYAYPPEESPPLPPSLPATVLSTQNRFSTSSNSDALSADVQSALTMEAALVQVASISLAELAGKLEIPVERLSLCTIQDLAVKLQAMNLNKPHLVSQPILPLSFESNFGDDDDDFSTASVPSSIIQKVSTGRSGESSRLTYGVVQTQPTYDKYAVFRELAQTEASGLSGFSICDSQVEFSSGAGDDDDDDEIDDQKSRTLTSRGSSSEKTLQAEFDVPGNGVSTMDDITDVNFSDGEEEEQSVLLDEVVDLNLKSEWATFESNFDEHFVPLATNFSKSGESAWESDVDNNKLGKFGKILPPTSTDRSYQPGLRSPKIDDLNDVGSQFDFHLFDKPKIDSIVRQSSRNESHSFHRQSSSSSKHSERSFGNSRTIHTNSDLSDSGKDHERSYHQRHGGECKEERRRPESRESGSRRYSRDESDDTVSRRRGHRRRNYDDEDEEDMDSRSPVDRRRSHWKPEDDDNLSNPSSRQGQQSQRRSHHRHSHHNKYSSQSLSRREGRYGGIDRRRPSESEKYSNHESDFEDSYEDERRRGHHRRNSGNCGRSERDHCAHTTSSRPTSSGSGTASRNRKQKYRDSSRDYYYQQHHRDYRDSKHHRERDRGYGVPYYYRRRSNDEDDFEDDGRELSEYSDNESLKCRRVRGRRRQERERDNGRSYRYNSPSWDSDTLPSGKEEDEPDCGDIDLNRGTKHRRSDMDRPRDRIDRGEYRGDRERPSSSTYHGNRLDGNARKASRYQSDLSLNSTKSTTKLTEFRFEADFSPSTPSHSQQQSKEQQRQHGGCEGARGHSPIPKPSQPQPSTQLLQSNNKIESINICNKLSQPEPPTLTKRPTESPFTDNFVAATTSDKNRHLIDAFDSNSVGTDEKQSNHSINAITAVQLSTGQNGLKAESSSSQTSGSQEKSDDLENDLEDTSPNTPVKREEFMSSNQHRTILTSTNIESPTCRQIIRKPIISDTIHEVPDATTDMKKSDSYSIFDREKDPFADDDFFT